MIINFKNMPKVLKKENEGEGFLGGLFKGINNLVDLAAKLESEGGVISRQGEIKDIGKRLSSLDKLKGLNQRKDIKGVYGFTIRTGLGGTSGPRVESFGNVKKTAKGPVVEKIREPIVDIFEEKDHLVIIAEIPGVVENTIKTKIKDSVLILEAGEEGHLQYRKEILLPYPVNPKMSKRSYKNGVFNLEFKLGK